MPSALPPGDPAPTDGALPAEALAGHGRRPLGFYVHVPFCRVRCGYCDFNTYTAEELGSAPAPRGRRTPKPRSARSAWPGRCSVTATAGRDGLLRRRYADAAAAGRPGRDPGERGDEFGLADDAEVTTESNPDSVGPATSRSSAPAGFTRLSFGMQSAVPHVLATPGPHPRPARVPAVVGWARAAGFDQVSLDLIYGTPGESQDDWRTSLDAALACEPDHVSAYALIVEDGTALARQVRRGEMPMPDDDDLADKYLLADDLLTAAGLRWYEVSNWARRRRTGAGTTSSTGRRHWWGVGPGAHSHVGGVRWWNVKHPTAYADRIGAGLSPAHARELLAPRPAGRARASGAAPGRRAAGRCPRRHRPRGGARLVDAACSSRASRWCSPPAGGCSRTVVRDLRLILHDILRYPLDICTSPS